jgi:hypothetical protein
MTLLSDGKPGADVKTTIIHTMVMRPMTTTATTEAAAAPSIPQQK